MEHSGNWITFSPESLMDNSENCDVINRIVHNWNVYIAILKRIWLSQKIYAVFYLGNHATQQNFNGKNKNLFLFFQ